MGSGAKKAGGRGGLVLPPRGVSPLHLRDCTPLCASFIYLRFSLPYLFRIPVPLLVQLGLSVWSCEWVRVCKRTCSLYVLVHIHITERRKIRRKNPVALSRLREVIKPGRKTWLCSIVFLQTRVLVPGAMLTFFPRPLLAGVKSHLTQC